MKITSDTIWEIFQLNLEDMLIIPMIIIFGILLEFPLKFIVINYQLFRSKELVLQERLFINLFI